MSRVVFNSAPVREGDIFFPEKCGLRVGKQGFQKKSMWGDSV